MNLKYLTGLLVFVSVLSGEVNDAVLSKNKREIIELERQKVKERAMLNKYNWLEDITVNGTWMRDQDEDPERDLSISFSQNIFRFGGITSQMEYAEELKKLDLLSIEMEYQSDLKQLYTALIGIKSLKLVLEQNTLSILNSEMEIKHKTLLYQAGKIDISDLNSAILTKNTLMDKAKQLEYELLKTVNELKKYTSEDIETLEIPDLKAISRQYYLAHVFALNQAKQDALIKEKLYGIKQTDYFPAVALNGSYGENKRNNQSQDYYTYGVTVTVPLSFTSFNAIEESKLAFLKAKQTIEDTKSESELTYDSVIQLIQSYEARIELAKNDIKLYTELIDTNQRQYKAGYKTMDDVNALENSKTIRELDVKISQLQIKNQLLLLYFDLVVN